MCAIFGGSRLFIRASGIFKVGWVVQCEEGRMSWGLDPFSPDLVEPCLSQIVPTWTWCGKDNALMSQPGKVSCHKGIYYYA